MFLVGCAAHQPYQVSLMPGPEVYDAVALNPLPETSPVETIPWGGVLYATNRAAATEGDTDLYYSNKRGWRLTVGAAQIDFGELEIDWEAAREISLLKNRSADYPLRVGSIEEFGPVESGMSAFERYEGSFADERFASLINDKLETADRRDVYIYVHGYKVIFEDPLLVATELWHFLGYDGVFVAFSWPSTPRRLAYLSDLETAGWSARDLRVLVEFLAANTAAERIHVVGYSAGTRVVLQMLAQLAYRHMDTDAAEIRRDVRLGHVMLIGSDMDRQLFGSYIADGLLRIPERLTIYLSDSDKAMGLARFVFGRERLGSIWSDADELHPDVAAFLSENRVLDLVDVSEAEDARAGHGHGYFRRSPWVSSDVLMTLMHGLDPERRGLMRNQHMPVWDFPPDYVSRLRASLENMSTGSRQPPGASNRDGLPNTGSGMEPVHSIEAPRMAH
jgi:esterase/lipase superfamily enzyme